MNEFRCLHTTRVVVEILQETAGLEWQQASALEDAVLGAAKNLLAHGHEVLDIYIPGKGEVVRIHCADIAFDISIPRNPARIH